MYIIYEEVANKVGKISVIVYEDHGSNPPDNSITVSSVPDPQQIDGKLSVPYINLDSHEIYYEYIDAPVVLDLEEEVNKLKKEIMEMKTILLNVSSENKNRIQASN
ncbi:hypothetical protein HUB98_22990 [Paenibacillus barcinonensis]|uniref:Uncharacterized protein n=1 Tax=Paenibacillus barcinonensis TaxID=198119 RepID=A0A2V4V928_PAEBA|nr:hypothetical protein [Paenibacillus barcinonensis]PYE48492.1 hypothetical protein DFQ00_10883 [Paenibacillus barcinonensis]QKS58801.1 hypothetical protein HUB98_22990 [Paenibacillus barcinonensis]